MQQEVTNKEIIREFYRRAVGQGDIDFANQIIADHYIQHSPGMKPGKAGVLDAIAYMKQMPKPASTKPPFMRLLAEGDYVVTNLSFEWGGKQKAVVDLFRFQNGKVAEHWDVIEDYPESSLNSNELMDGPLSVDDASLTAFHKELVITFFKRVFVEKQLDLLDEFVVTDLIQHTPEIANGLDGLRQYLEGQGSHELARNMQHVIAEGDFVVIQLDDSQRKYFDIFRLSNRKIVEHWSVKQVVS
jgi:predicted SnoaL-like aldol condensation-catalyzing enzyme